MSKKVRNNTSNKKNDTAKEKNAGSGSKVTTFETSTGEFEAITEYLNAQISKNEQLNNTAATAETNNDITDKPFVIDVSASMSSKRVVPCTDSADELPFGLPGVGEKTTETASDILLPTNTDEDLKSSDMRAIHDRNEIYNRYLKNYVSNFSLRTYHQRKMKKWFFIITMLLLTVIVIASSVSLILIVNRESLEAADAATAITAVIGMISTFLVLPKVIGDNLFPSKEEDQTHEIFSKMVENDMNLRKFHDHAQEQSKSDDTLESTWQ